MFVVKIQAPQLMQSFGYLDFQTKISSLGAHPIAYLSVPNTRHRCEPSCLFVFHYSFLMDILALTKSGILNTDL